MAALRFGVHLGSVRNLSITTNLSFPFVVPSVSTTRLATQWRVAETIRLRSRLVVRVWFLRHWTLLDRQCTSCVCLQIRLAAALCQCWASSIPRHILRCSDIASLVRKRDLSSRSQLGTSLGRRRMAPRSHLNRFSLESDWLRLGWQRRAGANFSTGGDLRRQPRGSSFRLHPRGLGRWPETAAHRSPSHYLATADLGRGYRKTVICTDGYICKWGGSTNCSVGHSPERKMGAHLSRTKPSSVSRAQSREPAKLGHPCYLAGNRSYILPQRKPQSTSRIVGHSSVRRLTHHRRTAPCR